MESPLLETLATRLAVPIPEDNEALIATLAARIVAHGRETGVRFLAGGWILTTKNEQPTRCACAVGQLALALGYTPQLLHRQDSLFFKEDSFTIYLFLQKQGFKPWDLDQVSNGFESSYADATNGSYSGDDDASDLDPYRLGQAIFLAVSNEIIGYEDLVEQETAETERTSQ